MRIAIANDMALAREGIARLLAGSPEHRIAWTARDGNEAVAQCAADLPDLLLMDIFMPGLDGVEATRRIMAETPCPVLIVTGSVEGHTSKVFEALGAGALDVVKTPVLGPDGRGEGGAALLAKISVLTKLVGGRPPRKPAAPSPGPRPSAAAQNLLVAIGASAGGPAALAAVLAEIPADFPAAIVIVQHVDAQFSGLLAKWLNEQSTLPVRIAADGDPPEPGAVLLAGSNDHLVLAGPHTLRYEPEPRKCSYRPSVDVFFESVAARWKGRVAGVLLTGMGRDGAKGLKALRDRGALTIAQDQASCVVYGMPKAAVALGAAAEVLPLDRIGPRLAGFFPHSPSPLFP